MSNSNSNQHGKRERPHSSGSIDSIESIESTIPRQKKQRTTTYHNDEEARLGKWDLIIEGNVENLSNMTIESLFHACWANRLDIAKILIQRYGININEINCTGKSLLHDQSILRNIDCVHFLLEHGINVNIRKLKTKRTPLYIACKHDLAECIPLLLEKGADPKLSDINYITPLYLACKNGYVESARLILEHSINTLDTARDNSYTPLIISCLYNQVECVRLLLEKGADTTKVKKNRVTPLYLACQEGHVECASLILEHSTESIQRYTKNGTTPLSIACKNGHIECVRLLLEKGADINHKTRKFSKTPLFIACEYGQIECVRLLLEKGVDISKSNKFGVTPLLIACKYDYVECVRLLLEKGADTTKADRYGTTPIYITCQKGYIDCVRTLLHYGVSVVNKKCINVAINKKHWIIVSLLLDYGAPIDERYNILRPQRIHSIEDKCAICMDSTKDLVLLAPCGHSCCCRDCMIPMISDDMLKCPLCRIKVACTLLLPKRD